MSIPAFTPIIGRIKYEKKSYFDEERMDYKRDYLNSKYWKEVRELIRQREGGYCRRCGVETNRGQTHHLTYKILGHEKQNLQYLVYLCPKCHDDIHEVVFKAPYWLELEK